MEQRFSQVQTQTQTQSQVQTQVMSPQQLLLVKLTEMPVSELETYVEKELIENPALEENSSDAVDNTEESSYKDGLEESEGRMESEYELRSKDYASEDDVPDYLQQGNESQQEQSYMPYGAQESFYENLKSQIGERDVDDTQRYILEYLIGSLDSDGLLRKSLDALSYELAINENIDVSVEELQKMLRILQTFEPAGIAATSLQECLMLQLNQMSDTDQDVALAKDIVRHHFDDFSNKRHNRICQIYHLDEAAFQRVLKVLYRLNPRPGSVLNDTISGPGAQVVIPDFNVTQNDDGTFEVSLNWGEIPPLRVSDAYRQSLEEYGQNRKNLSRQQRDAAMYIKQKVDAAQGFINAIMQRRDTLLRTMKAIVELQKDFFEEGDTDQLHPMILEDVSEKTGLDKSTISRVSRSKYVNTDYGIYPLKFFFNEKFVTASGDNLSKVQIKSKLQEIIEKEDKKNPLSDDDIADRLKEAGYPVARRTVAKYREKMKIPVARLRKA